MNKFSSAQDSDLFGAYLWNVVGFDESSDQSSLLSNFQRAVSFYFAIGDSQESEKVLKFVKEVKRRVKASGE